MGDHLTFLGQLRGELGHADVGLGLNPPDQKIPIGPQLARARRPALSLRLQRTRLLLALRNAHARARTHAEVAPRRSSRAALRYLSVDPLPQIARISSAHDPPPTTVNHNSSRLRIPPDSR